jgi:hypothetical protein
MPNLSGHVGGPMENFSIQNESGAQSGTKRQKKQVAKTAPVPPGPEAKFGKRACISIMLDVYGQPWKPFGQPLLQMSVVPAGKMRRIEQEAFADS